MKFLKIFSKKTYNIDEIKQALLAAEESRLRKQYPDDDAWRAPRNIADSMGCVGYAKNLLDVFEAKINKMSDTEITKLYKKNAKAVCGQIDPKKTATIANEVSAQSNELLLLPKILQDMSFTIKLKEGHSLPDGSFLERFRLCKNKNDIINLHWSVGFGYSMGAHNPGASGIDEIPSAFFASNDLSALATYISQKYKDFVSYDDIFYNGELQTLFALCAEEPGR